MTVAPVSSGRVVVAATLIVTVSGMPSFLTGASAVLMRGDLGFEAGGLGVAVAVFFVVCAVASAVGGHAAEALGPARSLRLVAVSSSLVLISIAVLVQDFSGLLWAMGFAGAVNGVAQPASNLALARSVRTRQALMFGVKQSAVPMATLLAGASVPLVGTVVGWRWSFAIASMLALVAVVVVPNIPGMDGPVARARREPRPAGTTLPLYAVAVASAFGTAAATSLGVYLVESAVASGFEVGTAGWLLTAGSAAGVVTRIVVGLLSDQGRIRALLTVGLMLVAGGFGFLLLTVDQPLVILVGVLIAYSLGWGWTGLMMFAIVRLHPEAPGVATGIVGAGASAGAAIGPFGFGVILSASDYRTAWSAAGAAALTSGLLLLGARTWIVRQRASAATSPPATS